MATAPLFLRALLAFLALPGIVGFAVPLWIAWPWDGIRWLGILPLAAGVALLLRCVREFYVAGKGTLAPWDPPRHLVTTGPYRLSRNPMYVGLIHHPGLGADIPFVAPAAVRDHRPGARRPSRSHLRRTVCQESPSRGYDRAGMGWSDPAPHTLTAGALARDLAELQDRAGLPAPFVLVASSVGGLTAEMFARQYPERAAGLIFLDAATSGLVGELEAPFFSGARGVAPVLAAAAQLGAIRLLNPFGITGDSDGARRSRGFTYGARAIGTLAAILRGASDTAREFAAAPPLRADVPLVVLSASDPRLLEGPGLRELSAVRFESRLRGHQRLAVASTRGAWKTVPNSQHLIAVSNPEPVADEIFTMLDQLR